MQGLLEVEFRNCYNEFVRIYNSNKYISKKEYDRFLDKYNDIFSVMDKYELKENDFYKKVYKISQYGYDIIDKKNKKFLNEHLIADKEYFDNMFKNIDTNIVLNDEQRKAILIDEDYSLVVSGAGSGKTTTMVAKVKYLIERKNVNPKDIILLAFSNKATSELDDMLNKKFNLGVDVLTFHKLGYKCLRNTSTKKIKVKSNKFEILSKYFSEYIFQNKNLLRKYMDLFGDLILIEEDAFNFETYNDYYNSKVDESYEKYKDILEEEIKRRIKNKMRRYKTIDGKMLKSEGEVRIYNYLLKNCITFEYEKLFSEKLINNRTYSPDFTLSNFENDIVVEYYGLAKLKINGEIECPEKYLSEINLKRKTLKKYGVDYIELFGRYEDKKYFLSELSKELSNRNMKNAVMSNKDIFYKLLESSKENKYIPLLKVMNNFIDLYKELGYKIDDFDRLIFEAEGNILKEQLRLFKDMFIYYEKTLHTSNNDILNIDFQDMIHNAYDELEKIKDNYNYKYIIIDEYQDISKQRYSFARKLSDLFSAKIVAVGDDWQTIYSFSGSDIELFTSFCETMGYGEIITISNTYRNCQELIDVASEFVTKNNKLSKKMLKSKKHIEKPIELIEYDFSIKLDKLSEKLCELIIKLYNDNPNQKILLLVRYNDEIEKILDSGLFELNYKNSSIKCNKCPDAYLEIMSIHKSKGLGFDQVILLNSLNINKGFPSHIKDEAIIRYIKGKNDISEDMFHFSEERRLFYVAMTRTKNKLYIMTPSISKYKSDFIKEIEDSEYVESY